MRLGLQKVEKEKKKIKAKLKVKVKVEILKAVERVRQDGVLTASQILMTLPTATN